MSYQGTNLSSLEGVFAKEDEDFPLRSESSSNLIGLHSEATSKHDSHTNIAYEPLSERRQRRKARPMPHKEFSLNSMYNIDTPYRNASLDLSEDFNANGSVDKSPKENPTESASLVDMSDIDDNIDEILSVKESESSESQACYGNENVVAVLRSEYYRWFYKYETDRNWTPFTGYDSIRIEAKFRQRARERELKAELENSAPQDSQEAGPSTESQEKKWFSSRSYFEYMESRFRKRSGSKGWFSSWIDEEAEPPIIPDEIPEGEVDEVDTEENVAKTPSSKQINVEKVDNVVFVRSGLYEANVDSWICSSTYWPADSAEITRGSWFYDGTWQPLPAYQAQRLEDEHMGKFKGTLLLDAATLTENVSPDSPTTSALKPVVHRVSFTEFDVDWKSPTEIHLYSKAASYQFMRSVGQRLGFQTWGHRLCRGYMKPATIIDRPSEINHIVFVVHGIGQKMDTGRIVRNCATFRECVASMRNRYFPQQVGSKQRAEFFPIEWRSYAKLDGDIVEAITPIKLLSLRQLLNATAMDIMYYTSPLYRSEIQNALKSELNRIYANFIKRNPNFETNNGKVSILAHSLGAVITYDIITGYTFEYQPDWPAAGKNGPSKSMQEINQEGIIVIDDETGVSLEAQPKGLHFKLEHFFCLGSPLAVFLALRCRHPHDPELRPHILPHHLCKRIYNVFHPSDPVAYRLEPLLNQAYKEIPPLCINAYNALVQSKYEHMSKEAIGEDFYFSKGLTSPPTNAKGGYSEQLLGLEIALLTVDWVVDYTEMFSKYKLDLSRGIWNFMKSWRAPGQSEGTNDQEQEEGASSSPPSRPSPTQETQSVFEGIFDKIEDDLDYRMDYVLRESNLSNSYIAALTSHTSYWSSPDIAFFVLTHLYNGPLGLKYLPS